MKVTKHIVEKEVTKIEKIEVITLELSKEEASLLRTSSYILRDKITEGGELHQLYTGLYANLANVVPAVSVQKVKAQFTF